VARRRASSRPDARLGLLFPSETGGFRAASGLDKPFRAVTSEMGLRKTITPKAMRRTFPDLPRNADIEQIVRQKICGHATDEMSDLYSTIPPARDRAGGRKIVSLAGYRKLMRDSASWCEKWCEDVRKHERPVSCGEPTDRLLCRISVGVARIELATSTV
jgi:integrase